MDNMNRHDVMKLAATAGAAALARSDAQAPDPPSRKTKQNTEPRSVLRVELGLISKGGPHDV